MLGLVAWVKDAAAWTASKARWTGFKRKAADWGEDDSLEPPVPESASKPRLRGPERLDFSSPAIVHWQGIDQATGVAPVGAAAGGGGKQRQWSAGVGTLKQGPAGQPGSAPAARPLSHALDVAASTPATLPGPAGALPAAHSFRRFPAPPTQHYAARLPISRHPVLVRTMLFLPERVYALVFY